MQLVRDHKEVFADVETLVRSGQLEAAKQQLEVIHIDFHDDAFVHLYVHVWQFRIARTQRNARRLIGEILPIMFAVPTSYVQKYLGLALASRMKH